MIVSTSLDSPLDASGPIALTMGFFDGVHRGHQAIFQKVRSLGATAICLTFSNHPRRVIRPNEPVNLLTTTAQRVQLIRDQEVDHLYLLEFTHELATKSPGAFLDLVRTAIPFNHLVLGHDARIGHRRKGTPDIVRHIAAASGFTVDYLPPVLHEGTPIASTRIREAVEAGNLALAETLLGHPYAINSIIQHGAHLGNRLGFRTANLSIASSCTPPRGVYAVQMRVRGQTFPGVANLGVAPTLQAHREPLLEVHLFDITEELYGERVDVTFHGYIRPEHKFESTGALRTQISQDIAQAQALLGSV